MSHFQLTINERVVGLITDAMTGVNVDDCRQHPCSSRPCLNGGRCVPVGDAYRCRCPIGFDSANCQVSKYSSQSASLSPMVRRDSVIQTKNLRHICSAGLKQLRAPLFNFVMHRRSNRRYYIAYLGLYANDILAIWNHVNESFHHNVSSTFTIFVHCNLINWNNLIFCLSISAFSQIALAFTAIFSLLKQLFLLFTVVETARYRYRYRYKRRKWNILQDFTR